MKRLKTSQVLKLLRDFESRNVTFIESDGSWPIVWEQAKGTAVWDGEGRKYLDLTAAFGVAAAGHANSRVVRAGQAQMAKLLHAMGDVHPHALKAKLARELSRITFERWTAQNSKPETRNSKPETGKTIFCNSGFEAVEAALKTARLATGRQGIIAFEGAYHGLGYGALNATHRAHFRRPFRNQLRQFGNFVPFPGEDGLYPLETRIRELFGTRQIGAILVEPIQVRGGIQIPPPGFLQMLRALCNERGALLILDEIYTGFGRTGQWFACEHDNVVPDIICLGKALTGGFPMSACVGRADVMDAAWPPSSGEAIHTSTFLGHPVGCAMALAQIQEIRRLRLPGRSARLGSWLLDELRARMAHENFEINVRGKGLLAGVELRHSNRTPATDDALLVIKVMLREGFILLPEGEHSNVISLTPPLTITRAELNRTMDMLADVIDRVATVPFP